jgi:hypothetical protein
MPQELSNIVMSSLLEIEELDLKLAFDMIRQKDYYENRFDFTVAKEVDILMNVLDENKFIDRFQWLNSSLFWILQREDAKSFERLIGVLRFGEFPFNDLAAEEKTFYIKLFSEIYKKDSLCISETYLEELEKKTFFNSRDVEKIKNGSQNGQQCFNNKKLKEKLGFFLLLLNPNDEAQIRIQLEHHALETYDILKRLNLSKEIIQSYIESFLSQVSPVCKDEESCWRRLSIIFLQMEFKKEEGALAKAKQLFGNFFGVKKESKNFEDDLISFFKEIPELNSEVEDRILGELFINLGNLSTEKILELKHVFETYPAEASLSYSDMFLSIKNYFAQLNLLERPDSKKDLAEGLEYRVYKNPSITALYGDSKKISLRVVHTDSWRKGKTVEEYLKENPSAYGGINGGFWGYDDTGLFGWASRRFLGGGNDSTLPTSILQTPRGLVNDSKDYWAAIGWKETADGIQIHASDLKIKWEFILFDKKYFLEKKDLVPYSTQSLIILYT